MTARRNALGRGLGALIPGAGESPPPSPARETRDEEALPGRAESAPGTRPQTLAVDAIAPNPEQPRRIFDPEHLESLAASLRRHGVLQPVVVRRAGEGRFELVVGERRWRAARAAGLQEIPAVIADVEAGDRLELAIVENVQRRDLNPIELATAYRALTEAGHTQEEIGAKVGMDRSSIANHLRLLELSREIQEDVESGRLSMGHAKALLQVPSPERRRHLRQRILDGSLSVREAERLGREVAGPTRRKTRVAGASEADPRPEHRPLVEQLQERLQTRVRIHSRAERGRIEIQFFSEEELVRLCSLLLDGAEPAP